MKIVCFYTCIHRGRIPVIESELLGFSEPLSPSGVSPLSPPYLLIPLWCCGGPGACPSRVGAGGGVSKRNNIFL